MSDDNNILMMMIKAVIMIPEVVGAITLIIIWYKVNSGNGGHVLL